MAEADDDEKFGEEEGSVVDEEGGSAALRALEERMPAGVVRAPQILVFASLRQHEHVREDRTSQIPDDNCRMRFINNSRSWRNSWLVQVILNDHGWVRAPVDQSNWDVWWCAGQAKTSAIRKLLPWQRLNKFPKSKTLTLKANLYATVSRAAALYGKQHFYFMPETFVMPDEQHALEAQRSKPEYAAAVWIAKPYAEYCGRGIFLLANSEAIPAHALQDRFVISRYVAQPYLIAGLKSDLRLYTLVTCWHPLIAYVFENGLVRFATEQYTLDPSCLQQRTAHITNYTLNKRSLNFKPTTALEQDGTGSKWTLAALSAHIRAHSGTGAAEAAMRAIDDLVLKTCIAAEPAMVSHFNSYVPQAVRDQPYAGTFQLFGFDVMLDEQLAPWLLEVNLDPSLGTDSPLDFNVKSKMLVDMLNLLGLHGCPLSPPVARGHGRANPPTDGEEARQRMPQHELRRWRALKQANDELGRSRGGGWRRLLPAAHGSAYSGFFQEGRDLNLLPFDL